MTCKEISEAVSSARITDSIDGVDELQKRDRTRLWYRVRNAIEQTVSPGSGSPSPRPVSAVRIVKAEPAQPRHTDRLVSESVVRTRHTSELVTSLNAETSARSDTEVDEANAITEWRDAPTHCPVLLLSASPILDARNPGPILGPGTRYRILAVDDGIVALKVATLDGQIGLGYCNAVDLICFEPDIVYYRRERQSGRLGTARLGITKLSQRISGVTGSLGN